MTVAALSRRWRTRQAEARLCSGLSQYSKQRDYVSAVNEALKTRAVDTFYDKDHAVELWGKNHTEELPRIYAQDTHLVLMFISEHYVGARWPRHERRAILTEMTQREGAYLLPVRFDDSPVPGLDEAWHYLEASKFTPAQLAEAAYQQSWLRRRTSNSLRSVSVPGSPTPHRQVGSHST